VDAERLGDGARIACGRHHRVAALECAARELHAQTA
jgi:hypothetical protein